MLSEGKNTFSLFLNSESKFKPVVVDVVVKWFGLEVNTKFV